MLTPARTPAALPYLITVLESSQKAMQQAKIYVHVPIQT